MSKTYDYLSLCEQFDSKLINSKTDPCRPCPNTYIGIIYIYTYRRVKVDSAQTVARQMLSGPTNGWPQKH